MTDNKGDVNINNRYAEPSVIGRESQKVIIPVFNNEIGADEIVITPEIKANSLLLGEVNKYNSAVHRYNDALDNNYEGDIKRYSTELMNIQKQIEYTSKNEYIREQKYKKLEVTKSDYKLTSSGMIFKYNKIPITPYYESIGLAPKIMEMNKNIDEYNAKVEAGETSANILDPYESKIEALEYEAKAASENPQNAVILNKPKLLIKQYPEDVRNAMNEAITNKGSKTVDISRVSFKNFSDVEKDLIEYNSAVEELKKNPRVAGGTSKIIFEKVPYKIVDGSQVYKYKPYVITPYLERIGAADKIREANKNIEYYNALIDAGRYSEYNDDMVKSHKRKINEIETNLNYYNLNEKNEANDNANERLNQARDKLYNKATKHSSGSGLPGKYEENSYNAAYQRMLDNGQVGAGAKDESQLYSLLGHELQEARKPDDQIKSDYLMARTDYLNYLDKYKSANAAGVDRDQAYNMYNELEIKRNKFKEKELAYRKDTERYFNELNERGTYLTNYEMEVLPTDNEEREKFKRLQNLEKVINTNNEAALEYNSRVGSIDKSKGAKAVYDERIKLLEEIANSKGLQKEYQIANTENLDINQKELESDTSSPGEMTNIREQSGDKDAGHDRSRGVDPAERNMFVMSKQQEFIDQSRFENFSKVTPNNFLGSANPKDGRYYNVLLKNEKETYANRFNNATIKPKPTITDFKKDIEVDEEFENMYAKPDVYHQPVLTNVRESAFGKNYFEDYQVNPYVNNEKVQFTNEIKRSANWYDWENKRSLFHPDVALVGKYEHHGVPIGEPSRPPGYEYTNARSYLQTNVNANNSIEAERAGIRPNETGDNRTNRNDRLFSKSIYAGLNKYQL